MKRSLLYTIAAALLALALVSCSTAEFEAKMAAEREARKAEAAEHSAKESKMREDYLKEAELFRQKYLDKNPLLSLEHRAAILEKRPIVGLTPDEAWFLVGPMLKVTASDGLGGSWAMYETALYRYPKLRLFFQNGRLVRWLEI